MKFFTVMFLSIILCCGGKLHIDQSTSQEWVGGLQESGYGTDYKLTVKVRAGSDKLRFEDLWVGETHMKVRVLPNTDNPRVAVFKKGDQIEVRAGFTFRPDADHKLSMAGADKMEKPFNFKGEGLLGYWYKGKKSYLVIPEFKKLEKIIYP